jgi:hypothetical protein
VVVNVQGKTKEDDTILLNSGGHSVYPVLSAQAFSNPRKVQIPKPKASQQGRLLGSESVRITEHEQEYSAHGQ